MEEESQAEKRQIQAMHQQRVISRINQKKKLAMNCYTRALNEAPQANTHRVQKCLQKLLRSLHKDRHHTIQHFRHLLEMSFEQAEREREMTIEHLADIDRLVNESLHMLSRYDELNAKILPLMEDYLIALRSRDKTPAALLRMDKQHEKELIDNYTTGIQQKIKERERDRMEEKRQRIEARKAMMAPTTSTKSVEKQKKADGNRVAAKKAAKKATTPNQEKGSPKEELKQPQLKIEVHATATHHEAEQHLEPKVAHSQSHELSHGQASYSVRNVDAGEKGNSGPIYMTLSFAGVALMTAMIVGIVVMKKRNGRHPHHQGFVEVDQTASPEERHVASMQMNGYENPTYKYFEATTT